MGLERQLATFKAEFARSAPAFVLLTAQGEMLSLSEVLHIAATATTSPQLKEIS